MRHSKSLLRGLLAAAVSIVPSLAPADGGAEAVARAAWSPTRTPRNHRTVAVPIPPRDTATATSRRGDGRQGAANPVRLADHRVPVRKVRPDVAPESPQPQPLPMRDPEAVRPAGHATIAPPVLDGQIIHHPPTIAGPRVAGPPVIIEHGDGLACDALPGGCGCGDSICDGGCDAGPGFAGGCCDGGCDSLGGGGCCSMCGELCSPNAWRPCVTVCLPQDGWFSAEYLYWWQDGLDTPPLITGSVDDGVAQNRAGVLGDPLTRTLFGGNDVIDDGLDGFRLRFGVWLNRCHTWGVGAEYFNIGEESESFTASGDGSPVLARPLINVNNGSVEESELVSFPGVVGGTVSARATSELTGAGFNFRNLRGCDQGCSPFLWCACPTEYCSRSELLVGYRYLQLEESIAVTENLTSALPSSPGMFDISDRFRTTNQFNGLDLGWYCRHTRGFWTFDSTFRLAFGTMHQTVRIDGSTVISGSGTGDGTFGTGILAGPGNIGTFDQDEFAVVPEVGFNVGYQLTDRLRVFGGYTFLYMSNVVRPGDVIDRRVNTDLFAPPVATNAGNFPTFAFDTTDYWAQGINVGAELRW